jgi:hypothetical protein
LEGRLISPPIGVKIRLSLLSKFWCPAGTPKVKYNDIILTPMVSPPSHPIRRPDPRASCGQLSQEYAVKEVPSAIAVNGARMKMWAGSNRILFVGK